MYNTNNNAYYFGHPKVNLSKQYSVINYVILIYWLSFLLNKAFLLKR